MIDMGADIYITEKFTCYVCKGQGFIRLNHAASSSCWKCDQGYLFNDMEQNWTSFARCVADHDPFQNGAHTTWPLFMIDREIARWERANEDIQMAMRWERNETRLNA